MLTTQMLTVADAPDVLVRVLTTLRRRGCTIVSVDFSRGDIHREGRLRVTYEPPVRANAPVGAWLGNLVDVLAVTEA
jgi:acetolactate synthase regulatory subunit